MRHAVLCLAGLAAVTYASAAYTFDLEKAKTYGQGKGDIPKVDDNDGIMGIGRCRDVAVSSGWMRVARLMRAAKAELREVKPEELEAAGGPDISVSYTHRAPYFESGKNGGWRCTGSEAVTRVILMDDKEGNRLEPIAFEPSEREATYGSGAVVTVHEGYARFDREKALAIAGGGDLKVAIIYSGANKVFKIKAKDLKHLEPSWMQ